MGAGQTQLTDSLADDQSDVSCRNFQSETWARRAVRTNLFKRLPDVLSSYSSCLPPPTEFSSALNMTPLLDLMPESSLNVYLSQLKDMIKVIKRISK
jgi:hypothetical protein